MVDVHTNLAVSLVATAPSPATSGTSLVVTTGEGANFPDPATTQFGPYNVLIWPAGTIPTKTNAEIVRVTAKSTDTLTITRAQESTTARTVVVGDQIAMVISAKVFSDIEDVINGVVEPGDHSFLSWNFDPIINGSTSTPLGANGTLYVQRIRIDKRVSVTNLHCWILTAGVTLTASQNGMAIYDASKNLIGQTADQSTAWTSTGFKTAALTGGPFVLQPGLYYVVFMSNGTTRPAPIRCTGTAHNANIAAASSRWATADTARTTFPATLGAFTAAANPYWVAIS